jgi:3-deoxy-D-manno-octulosonic-acid transferase
MHILYEIVIRLYILLIRAAAPFSDKAAIWVNGRNEWEKRLRKAIPAGGKVVWFHCASLGEFEQGRPIIEAVRKEYPDRFLLVSFFSPSGYEIRKNYSGADFVSYLPADTMLNVNSFLDISKPEIAVFIKYEFWYNFLRELDLRKIPVLLVSARFRRNQYFFKWYGGWFRKKLKHFTAIHVQDADSAELLKKAGYHKVMVSGDSRYDRVKANAANPKNLPEIKKWLNGRNCFIAGSTWQADDKLLLPWKHSSTVLIIAPHEIDEERIEALEAAANGESIRYSELKRNPGIDKNILILDNIGMLLSVYRLGIAAYVGGGLGKGLHNILEPAACGLPVIFGPRHEKFPEAAALEKAGGGKSISTASEFDMAYKHFTHPKELKKFRNICLGFVSDRVGATHKIMISIRKILTPKAAVLNNKG